MEQVYSYKPRARTGHKRSEEYSGCKSYHGFIGVATIGSVGVRSSSVLCETHTELQLRSCRRHTSASAAAETAGYPPVGRPVCTWQTASQCTEITALRRPCARSLSAATVQETNRSDTGHSIQQPSFHDHSPPDIQHKTILCTLFIWHKHTKIYRSWCRCLELISGWRQPTGDILVTNTVVWSAGISFCQANSNHHKLLLASIKLYTTWCHMRACKQPAHSHFCLDCAWRPNHFTTMHNAA